MDRVALLMSVHRALWGEVPPRLRSVSCQTDTASRIIHIRFIFDGTPDDADLECVWAVGAEVEGDFIDEWRVKEETQAVPWPEHMNHLSEMAFLRHERAADPGREAGG